MPYSTKQCQAIFRCLEAQAQEALTAGELAETLRREGTSVGLATIYRQLERLEAAGRVHRVQTEEGALYQFCPRPAGDHACFLLRCEDCGRISHLDCGHLQSLFDHLTAEHQFRVDPRRTVLTGRCQTCAQKEVRHGAQ